MHVPWCRVVCPYCAFYVVPDRGEAPTDAFVDGILAEHRRWAPAFPGRARSVFLGGGTPSRLPPEALGRLLAGLPAADEIGVEANPEDVDDAWLDAALEAGVTRISIGVQSFEPRHARRLGRGHGVPQAEAALARIARCGVRSWSLDLIFAVPGQTLDDLERDVARVVDSGAPHVSLYGLTIEDDTPFARLQARGRLRPPPDELWRDMYDLVVDRLGAAGIARYEVSNFARPGHRSVHNTGYWEGRPYMGLGPSAHGFAPDGRRWTNPRDLAAWLVDPRPAEVERPVGEDAAADRLVAGLRWVEGVDLGVLEVLTGHRPAEGAVEALVAGGLLARRGSRVALTPAGFPVADSVALRLVDALRPIGMAGPASDAG